MKHSSLMLLALAWLIPASASAHVYIEMPEDGATLQPGESVEIVWNIAVNHGPPDTYDLMFSRNGGSQYQMIAEGLAATPNSYVWTAPDENVPDAVLAIVQHGSNGYEFMHEVALQVGDAPADPDMGQPDMGQTDAGELLDRPDASMAVDDDDPTVPSTGEEVLGLLERRCATSGCHDAETAQANLDLSREAFGENLVDVPATTSDAMRVSLDDPESSELIHRLRGDAALRMPPPPEEELSADRIDALVTWISVGAPAEGPLTDDAGPIEGTGSNETDRGCATTPSAAASGWVLLLGLVGLLVRRRRR